ncbi:MAG: DUF3488 domain-containing protein [Myxococcales bacterium]|nr:DUF3488 domain-containing protein [Myxococcales bacterium]
MRFVVVHKVTSFLMVLTSLLALVASGELHPLVSALALGGLAVSWFWEPPRVDPARYDTAWNVLTLLMLAKTMVDVFSAGSLLLSGVHFIVFLSINKAFNRRTSRDYLQLYVVSFLQMVAATALNSDLVYGVLFLAYIVFTTWTLILFHLKREMEENYLLKYGDSLQGRPVQVQRVLNSRKLVGGHFLLATSLVSLVVFAGALSFFFLFPRVGFGFFFKKSRPGIMMSGFSDRIELGSFGVIKDDPTVVMRVEFADPALRTLAEPYWRGIAFDHYDGHTWTKSRANTRRTVRPTGDHYDVRPDREPEGPTIEQAIYLEPMESRVLFGLSRLHHVRLDQPAAGSGVPLGRYRGIQIDQEGDVFYEQSDEVAFRYFVTSEPPIVDARLLRRPLSDFHRVLERAPYARYLQLPVDLAPRVRALAHQVVGDATTVGEAVDRLERHLRSDYAYTLDLQRDPSLPPVEDFLFVQRKGHCEYFATAMVIMLRAVGIPARSVNGFLGGTWNAYGGYLAVKQGNAHAWVEVLLPEERCSGPGACTWVEHWLTRDPTPAGAAVTASTGLLDTLQQYADALRLRWYKYVIEYDLEQQIGALATLRRAWRAAFGEPGDRKGRGRGGQAPSGRRVLGWALAVLLGAAILWLAFRRLRAGPPDAAAVAERRTAAVATLYAEMARQYGALGLARGPTTTASEYLRQLERRAAPQLDIARDIIDLYEAVRFGGAAPDPARTAALGRAVRTIGRPARSS